MINESKDNFLSSITLLMKDKRYRSPLLIVLYYFIGHVLIVPRIAYTLLYNFVSMNEISSYLQITCDGFSFFVIVFLARFYLIEMFAVFKKNIPSTFLYGLILYFPQMLTSAFLNVLVMLMTNIPSSSNQGAIIELLNTNFWPLAISAVIIAPIIEEIVFRGVLFRWFRRYGFFVASFISCFSFGFLHCLGDLLSQNYMGMVYIIVYMAMSFYFCLAYERSNNIYGAILLHFVNNLVAIIVSASLF